jgi:hypothetical protein
LGNKDILREGYLFDKLTGTLLITLVTKPTGESVVPCYSSATYAAIKEIADTLPHPYVIGHMHLTYETFDEWVYRKSADYSEYLLYWVNRAKLINGD